MVEVGACGVGRSERGRKRETEALNWLVAARKSGWRSRGWRSKGTNHRYTYSKLLSTFIAWSGAQQSMPLPPNPWSDCDSRADHSFS